MVIREAFVHYVLLFILITTTCIQGMDILENQPLWNKDLDKEHIEYQLVNNDIVEITDMRVHLERSNKIAHFANEVYLAKMRGGLYAVFKPEENLHDSFAEVAAYKASKSLNFGLVPPTVLKTYEGRTGSLQFMVKSPWDLLKREDNETAYNLLSQKVLSNKSLYYYIFGQWDTHAGNQMISYDEVTRKASLALIDNGALSNKIQVRYGDYAFVKRLHQDNFSVDFDKQFPYEQAQKLELPTTQKQVKKDLGGFKVSPEVITRWNNLGTKVLTYALWRNGLWIQFYKNNPTIKPNSTNYYPPKTMQAYESLTMDTLQNYFSEALTQPDSFCTQEHLLNILKRRDEVLVAAQNQKNN